jgi:hypothetical protein
MTAHIAAYARHQMITKHPQPRAVFFGVECKV